MYMYCFAEIEVGSDDNMTRFLFTQTSGA